MFATPCDESAGVTGVVWRVRHPFDHLWCGNSLNTQSKTRCTRFACKSLFPRWSYWYVVSGGADACGFLVPLQTVVVKQEYLKMLKLESYVHLATLYFNVVSSFFLRFQTPWFVHILRSISSGVRGRHINHLFFCNPQIYSKTHPYEWRCRGVVFGLSLKLHLWYVSINVSHPADPTTFYRGLTLRKNSGRNKWLILGVNLIDPYDLMTLWGLCLGRVKHARNVYQSIPRGLRSRQLSNIKM